MKRNQFWFSILLAASAVSIHLSRAENDVLYSGTEDRAVRIETFRTHSRLFFRIDPQFKGQWKSSNGQFEYFFPKMRLTDMGAPFGEEQEWARQFSDVKDQRLQALVISEAKDGVHVSGQWRFPTGPQAPARAEMERFEFQQEGYLVLDFWEQKGPSLGEMRQKQKQQRQLASIKEMQEKAARREQRLKLAENRIKEASDLTSFCRYPMNESKEVFLHFSALHQPVSLEQWFSVQSPDRDFVYTEPKSDEGDSKYVRVALELYHQGKPALTLKSLDFLDKEFPKSSFHEEMRFLRANAYVKLGMEKEADAIFKDLILDAKGSAVAMLAAVHLAEEERKQGQHLQALEHFLWLSRYYPDHRLNWVFHFGTAEALFYLGQTERSAAEYEWLVTHAPDRDAQAEAALRMGDAFMERKEYEQAIASYFKGMNFYKEQANRFAPVHLNRAEALYWLGQYDRAEAGFKEYLERFPTHPSGWRATYRLAEIYGRRGGEGAEQKASDWYHRTINRYPFTPGATLSRLRLVQCGNHGEMDFAAATRLFDEEANQFNGDGQVKTDLYRDEWNIAKMRSWVSMERWADAVQHGADALSKTLRPETRKLLSSMFGRSLRKEVLRLLDDGKKYEALGFYNLYSASVVKEGEPLIPDFLIKLTDAAVELNIGSLAQKLIEDRRISETAFQKTYGGREIAASSTEIDQRFKRAREAVTEARALWARLGVKADAEIATKLSEVSEDSPSALEREVLLGLLNEQKGDIKAALPHAQKAYVLASGKSFDTQAQVGAWLAQLHAKLKSNKQAVEVLDELISRMGTLSPDRSLASDSTLTEMGFSPVPQPVEIYLQKAELLEADSRWGDAVQTYSQIIEKTGGDNRVLYSYASALRKNGGRSNLIKARATFQKITESGKDDFWKKLAQEALEDDQLARWKPSFKE